MTAIEEARRLDALEAVAFETITAEKRAGWRWVKGMTALQRRECDRLLYAKLGELRELGVVRTNSLVRGLGVSAQRLWKLREAPPSEQQIKDRREEGKRRTRERVALVRERERRRLAWHHQNQLDEKHEMQANAVACLIEALEEMRPYSFWVSIGESPPGLKL